MLDAIIVVLAAAVVIATVFGARMLRRMFADPGDAAARSNARRAFRFAGVAGTALLAATELWLVTRGHLALAVLVVAACLVGQRWVRASRRRHA